jgi:hypothetical protein
MASGGIPDQPGHRERIVSFPWTIILNKACRDQISTGQLTVLI